MHRVLPYGSSYDLCFRLDLNQRPLPCEGSALTNCATEAMTEPCDSIWVMGCIIHSPELPHLDSNQDEQIQSLSCYRVTSWGNETFVRLHQPYPTARVSDFRRI